MAEEEKNGKKKKKGCLKGCLTGILTIILAILLIVTAVLSIFDQIIDWIINIVKNIISGIVDFFTDPLGTLSKWGSGISNFFSRTFDMESFNATEYEALRTDPIIVISDENMQTTIDEMDRNINRDIAGLDNVMLKKLILTHYKGFYLDDTTILIQLTNEDFGMEENEWNSLFEIQKYKKVGNKTTTATIVGTAIGTLICPGWGSAIGAGIGGLFGTIAEDESIRTVLTADGKEDLKKKYGEQIYPFDIIEGDPETLQGEDGAIYLKTKGMLKIFVDGSDIDECDGCTEDANREKCAYTLDKDDTTHCNYKIKYYSNTIPEGEEESPFTKLYKHYWDNFNEGEDRANYTEAVKDYLVKCYTYTNEGIRMYSTRETVNTEQTWSYENEKEEERNGSSRVRHIMLAPEYPLEAQNLNFSQKVSEYAIPAEFLVNLLEITSSKDFVNNFIERACSKDYYVTLKLYEMTNTTIEEENDKRTRKTYVFGSRSYRAEIIKYKPRNGEWITGNDGKASVEVDPVWDANKKKTFVNVKLNNYTKETIYKVALFVNGVKEKESDFSVHTDSFLWIFNWEDDESKDSWAFNFMNTTSWEDESKITQVTTTTTESLFYAIGITEVKTWYATMSAKNSIKETVYLKNLQGTPEENTWKDIIKIEQSEDILKDFGLWAVEKINQGKTLEDEIKFISYGDYPEVKVNVGDLRRVENYKVIDDEYRVGEELDPPKEYKLSELLDVQFNYVSLKTKNSYGYNAKDYILTEMNYIDKDVKKLTLSAEHKQELNEGIETGQMTYTRNYSTFLSLLCNETGSKEGTKYKPETSGGKIVEYDSLYGGKIDVITRLKNTSGIMFELMAKSGDHDGGTAGRESLIDVMKRLLNYYDTGNYTITNPNETVIYKDEEFVYV